MKLFRLLPVLAAAACAPLASPIVIPAAPLPPAPALSRDVAGTVVPPYIAFGGAYDESNPFARILRGELPVAKLYEDDTVLAFMDNAPRAPGHVLVIAKLSKARNLLEMDQATLNALIAATKRVAAAQRMALGSDGIVVQQNNGVAQSVPHLHIHVIPVTAGIPLKAPESNRTPLAILETMAARLRAAWR